MEEEEESVVSLRAEEKEIEAKMVEIRREKEAIQQELSASELLEKDTQESIGIFQQQLEEQRKSETEAASHLAEWELKVEKNGSSPILGRSKRPLLHLMMPRTNRRFV